MVYPFGSNTNNSNILIFENYHNMLLNSSNLEHEPSKLLAKLDSYNIYYNDIDSNFYLSNDINNLEEKYKITNPVILTNNIYIQIFNKDTADLILNKINNKDFTNSEKPKDIIDKYYKYKFLIYIFNFNLLYIIDDNNIKKGCIDIKNIDKDIKKIKLLKKLFKDDQEYTNDYYSKINNINFFKDNKFVSKSQKKFIMGGDNKKIKIMYNKKEYERRVYVKNNKKYVRINNKIIYI